MLHAILVPSTFGIRFRTIQNVAIYCSTKHARKLSSGAQSNTIDKTAGFLIELSRFISIEIVRHDFVNDEAASERQGHPPKASTKGRSGRFAIHQFENPRFRFGSRKRVYLLVTL